MIFGIGSKSSRRSNRRGSVSSGSADGADIRGKYQSNRTFTSSLSHTVTATKTADSALASGRTKTHHLIKQRRRVGRIFIGVVLFTIIIIYLMSQYIVNIKVINAQSLSSVPIEQYETAINDYYKNRPFERFKFNSSDNLHIYMSAKFPEIKSISLIDGYNGYLEGDYKVTLRQPVASWIINSTSNFVDKDGVIFQHDYFNQPLVKIEDRSGIPEITSNMVTSSTFLSFIGRLVSQATLNNINITKLIIPTGLTHQINAEISGHKYYIKLSLDRPVGEQVEDLRRTIDYLSSHHLKPGYVDIRVSGEAYYK